MAAVHLRGGSKTVEARNAPTPGSDQRVEAISGWTQIPGGALDIGVGPDAAGTTWIIGTNPGGGGEQVYRFNGSSFDPIAGFGVRIAVDNLGYAWVVNAQGGIYQWTGAFFSQKQGSAQDIAAGAGGSIWAIGTTLVANNNYGIFQYNGNTGGWTQFPGAAKRIAVAPDGSPWVVNAQGAIYHYVGGNFVQLPGAAFDISVDSTNHVFVIGQDNLGNGNSGIYMWDGVSTWIRQPGAANNISSGFPLTWVTNAQGGIYRGAP